MRFPLGRRRERDEMMRQLQELEAEIAELERVLAGLPEESAVGELHRFVLQVRRSVVQEELQAKRAAVDELQERVHALDADLVTRPSGVFPAPVVPEPPSGAAAEASSAPPAGLSRAPAEPEPPILGAEAPVPVEVPEVERPGAAGTADQPEGAGAPSDGAASAELEQPAGAAMGAADAAPAPPGSVPTPGQRGPRRTMATVALGLGLILLLLAGAAVMWPRERAGAIIAATPVLPTLVPTSQPTLAPRPTPSPQVVATPPPPTVAPPAAVPPPMPEPTDEAEEEMESDLEGEPEDDGGVDATGEPDEVDQAQPDERPRPTATISIFGFSGANLRRGPSVAAEPIRLLPIGARVELLGGQAAGDGFEWQQVRDQAGDVGWVVVDALLR